MTLNQRRIIPCTTEFDTEGDDTIGRTETGEDPDTIPCEHDETLPHFADDPIVRGATVTRSGRISKPAERFDL